MGGLYELPAPTDDILEKAHQAMQMFLSGEILGADLMDSDLLNSYGTIDIDRLRATVLIHDKPITLHEWADLVRAGGGLHDILPANDELIRQKQRKLQALLLLLFLVLEEKIPIETFFEIYKGYVKSDSFFNSPSLVRLTDFYFTIHPTLIPYLFVDDSERVAKFKEFKIKFSEFLGGIEQ